MVSMKALRIHGNKDIRLDDVPRPQPAAGEILLRIASTSICATDIEEWQHGPFWVQHDGPNDISGHQMPIILGHEISGRVEQLGDGVHGFAHGDRVAVNNVRTCETCFWCMRGSQATCPNMCVAGLSADGGLAEYMVWQASHLMKLPDSISDTEAPLIEPATVAVHAVRRSGVKIGDTVAILGCGTVGLLTLQAYRAAGARVIALDVRQESLNLAQTLGAHHVVNSADASETAKTLTALTDGIGPDIVTETAGAADTPRLAIEWTRPGGKTVLVGIYSTRPQLDFNQIVGAERTVIGSVAASPGDMATAIRMVADGKIQLAPLVSANISLTNAIQDGFQRMLDPQKNVFRIVVSP